jgi:hypothetical protein
MTLMDTNKLPAIERSPGWRGRNFDPAVRDDEHLKDFEEYMWQDCREHR